MRALTPADYVVIAAYLAVVLGFGLLLTRRAGKSVEQFFIAGRSLPWWLLGVSMAATNFSIDTPLTIAGFVGKDGIAGVWFFWSNAISALLVTFLFSRLWRRAAVLTDAEIVERRYGGKSASALRLFKGAYFGIVFNVFIMGWVFLALTKVVEGVTELDAGKVLIVATVLVFVYTMASGFYGVVLTDLFQYVVAFVGSVVLAVYAVREVGGLSMMVASLENHAGLPGSATGFWPSFSQPSMMPAQVFLAYLLVQWWAHKYADGGGKHIQRMLSAKDERHAMGASFFFSFVNYALQVWPWVLTGLCALIVFGRLEDPEMGYPMMMVRVLPAGVLGLVLACLIGAFMSTIDTHLNLGASYVVNDIYKRFLVRGRKPGHYVAVSRLVMAGLLLAAVLASLNMDSVGGAWKFLLTFASGAGLTWIVRWFWWRVNAWTEFSGMIASGVVATYLRVFHADWLYSSKLVVTVGITTVVWLTVTFLTPPTDPATLVKFVRDIRPGSWGWRRVYRAHGITPEPFLLRAIAGWLVSLVCLFSLNFAIGSLLLRRQELAVVLFVLALAGAAVLIVLVRSGPKVAVQRSE